MPDFRSLSDEQVVQYLLDHFADIGVGEPPGALADKLNRGIANDSLVLEKRSGAFAIVARANRKHSGRLAFVEISPQADLMFLMVAPESRGNGSGRALAQEVKARYMDGQAMELVCAGDVRRRYFESVGFRVVGLNESGHYVMACDPE